MKRTLMVVVCIAILWTCVRAEAADKKKAEAITQYCRVCVAASRVSLVLVAMLARHPHEAYLAAYAQKVAEANKIIFSKMKVPAGAEKVKEHFGKAVEAFKKAATLHRKAEYKEADEAAEECKREFRRAVAEVQKLRADGVIP